MLKTNENNNVQINNNIVNTHEEASSPWLNYHKYSGIMFANDFRISAGDISLLATQMIIGEKYKLTPGQVPEFITYVIFRGLYEKNMRNILPKTVTHLSLDEFQPYTEDTLPDWITYLGISPIAISPGIIPESVTELYFEAYGLGISKGVLPSRLKKLTTVECTTFEIDSIPDTLEYIEIMCGENFNRDFINRLPSTMKKIEISCYIDGMFDVETLSRFTNLEYIGVHI